MTIIGTSLLLFLLWAPQDKPKPKFPLGKETTYVTGPLDKEGYVDYEAALNDRIGKGISPEKNANVLLWKAFGPTPEGGNGMPAEYFRRLGIAEPPKEGDYFIGLSKYLKDQRKLDSDGINAVEAELRQAMQRPWTSKEFPHLAVWLEANEKPLVIVLEAAKRPDYFNPLVSRRIENAPSSLIAVLLPNVQKCRELASALTARALLRTGTGKVDEAWQDLLACHRLGRLVSRGGTLIEVLVGIAIDQITSQADLAYLERARLSSQHLRDRLKELQGLPSITPIADTVGISERLFYLDTLQHVRRDGVGFIEALSGGSFRKPNALELKALEVIDWEPALRSGNRRFDQLAAALRIADRATREKTLAKIEEELDGMKKDFSGLDDLAKLLLGNDPPVKTVGKTIGDILFLTLVPATRKLHNAYDKSTQVQRNLHIAFALAAYKRDHGSYPKKLNDLAPRYLANIANDLFTDKPLVYRQEANGYLLYSVGINGHDDEGRTQGEEPLGGDDIRIRMPLPEMKKE